MVSDKLDTFVFNGISLNHLSFVQTDNDLLIQQKGTQNQITVTGFFDGVSSFASLQDDFGNTLSSEQVSQLAQPIPNIDKNQTITGNVFANHLIGGSGNDVLYAKAGADTLRGGLGQDTYLFQVGDGNDTIRDSMGNDTLHFENINLDRLWFSRDGRNLQIEVLDGGGSVTVENYFLNTKSTHFSVNMIEHFQADNHYLSSSKIHQLLDAMGNFSPTKNPDWNVDVQKQQYLQNMQIEQYWHNLEQY